MVTFLAECFSISLAKNNFYYQLRKVLANINQHRLEIFFDYIGNICVLFHPLRLQNKIIFFSHTLTVITLGSEMLL